MTIQQRHEEINKILAEMKVRHEKYFPPARTLTDEEWENCIDDFHYTADRWKGTNLQDLAGDICMAFLNDIERVDKAWRRRGKDAVQKTEQE